MPAARRIVPSDETLIGMLSAGLTMNRIAKQVGVTRERIRQIYRDRLSSKFGGLTGRELQRMGTLARGQERSRGILPADDSTRKIWDLCGELGIEVARVSVLGKTDAGVFTAARLLIAGRKCSIHCASRTHSPGSGSRRRYYYGRSAAWEEAEFTVLVVGRDRVLVIPQATGRSGRIYVPERPGMPAYKGHKPRIDWWAYENAWRLLSQPA